MKKKLPFNRRLQPASASVVAIEREQECFGHLDYRLVQTDECVDHNLFVGVVVAFCANENVPKGEIFDASKARPIMQKNHVYYTVINHK